MRSPWITPPPEPPVAETPSTTASTERVIHSREATEAQWMIPSTLDSIEIEHPDGISSDEIVEIFMSRNFRFSKPTLAKWIQLGLLPQSKRRAGESIRKRHRGSTGMYPTSIVRRIQEIKKMMLQQNMTAEEIFDQHGVQWHIESTAAQLSTALEQAPDTVEKTQLETALAAYLAANSED